METLYATFYQKLESTPMDFFRDFHDSINWECRIIGLMGQKGVGKSTLLLQHIDSWIQLQFVQVLRKLPSFVYTFVQIISEVWIISSRTAVRLDDVICNINDCLKNHWPLM